MTHSKQFDAPATDIGFGINLDTIQGIFELENSVFKLHSAEQHTQLGPEDSIHSYASTNHLSKVKTSSPLKVFTCFECEVAHAVRVCRSLCRSH